MDNYSPNVIFDANATELDRAANFETAKVVAQRHADRLGSSTFIRPAGVTYYVQVKPSSARKAA